MEHYVVFDFETTGFSPQKNEIIQIGAVKYDQAHQEIARFNQLIKPTRSYLPTKISELTGIWPASLLEQPVLAEVLPDFIAFSRDSLMVAKQYKRAHFREEASYSGRKRSEAGFGYVHHLYPHRS